MVINDGRGNNLDKPMSAIDNKIREILFLHKKLRLEMPGSHPSAVLIPLYVEEGRHILVLTRRSQLVHYHKGEVSFPGGGYQPSDGNLRQTALRESFEEIGLVPAQVDILGELDDTLTQSSNFIITPFVGLIPAGYPFKTSDFEIGELIHIPVDALLAQDCCRSVAPVMLDGHPVSQCIFTYRDKQVIGATARVLRQFLDIYSQAAASVSSSNDSSVNRP
jgi:8-oxo-dGTP pyrophosphatase MutT (NUDIX family)